MFSKHLKDVDSKIFDTINLEKHRQNTQIELIASENFTSKAVIEACGSVLTNKYAEGYPNKRYYGGCEYVDIVEQLAIDRAKELFNCKFANVQPHSGSTANQAVFLSLLNPGDTFLGMGLSSGGHLSHGASVSVSGKWFNAISYGVRKDTFLIDYDEVYELTKKHKPKMIIAGGSSYPRIVDFKKFREIADEFGAFLVVDMAHFAGLVAGKSYPNPIDYAHIVTSTTHKTLRGPRSGIILTNDEKLAKKINSAVFPGLQGGPLMHIIAGKAVCFKEALDPSFETYAKNVIKNAKALSEVMNKRGYKVLTGGTDSHLLIVNTYVKGITGKDAAIALEKANITCNKNMMPFDELPPVLASGIRLGTPACTSRGFDENDFINVGNWISDILESINKDNNQNIIDDTRNKVLDLCKKRPLY